MNTEQTSKNIFMRTLVVSVLHSETKGFQF